MLLVNNSSSFQLFSLETAGEHDKYVKDAVDYLLFEVG